MFIVKARGRSVDDDLDNNYGDNNNAPEYPYPNDNGDASAPVETPPVYYPQFSGDDDAPGTTYSPNQQNPFTGGMGGGIVNATILPGEFPMPQNPMVGFIPGLINTIGGLITTPQAPVQSLDTPSIVTQALPTLGGFQGDTKEDAPIKNNYGTAPQANNNDKPKKKSSWALVAVFVVVVAVIAYLATKENN